MEIPQYIEVLSNGQTVSLLSPQADGIKDCYADIRLNSESNLEFSLPSDSEKANDITAETEILAVGRIYNFLEEETIEKSIDSQGREWNNYRARERWNELDKKFPEPYITNDPNTPIPADLAVIIVGGGNNLSGGLYSVGSAAHALYAVLRGSGWSMGVCDVPGIHDLEMEKVSILELVKKIQETWGGYLVWDSINRTVSLRSEDAWQNYTGFQIRYAKNLSHISKVQSNRIVTKLFCFGKDNLDIASVNGGLKYVTDFRYTNKVYTGIYTNPDIEDANELKQKGIAELALNCQPRYAYRVGLVDLRVLPEYSHEEFKLGDMVDVVEKGGETVTARLMQYRHNVFQPWEASMEIGDVNERLVEKLKASFDTTQFINNTFASNGELSGRKIVDGTIIGNSIAAAALDASKFNTKQLILTGDIWQDNTPSGGYVTWNSHKLFYGGLEYTITGASTNKKYIVWQKDLSSTTYRTYTQVEFDSVVLKDYDFVIAVNNGGLHDIAWYNRTARQFIASAFIANAAIKTVHIEDAAIVTAKIANLAVQRAHIADAAINSAKIDNAAITTAKIGDLQVTNLKIGDTAITERTIQNLAVTDSKIQSLTASKITAGTITATISIMSPLIQGGSIYAARFYGAGGTPAYLEVGFGGASSFGDLALKRNSGSMVFQVYDDIAAIRLRALDNNFLLSSGYTTWPQGTWDFSSATVTGITSVTARFA